MLYFFFLTAAAEGQDFFALTTEEILTQDVENQQHYPFFFEPKNDTLWNHLALETVTILRFILDFSKWADIDSIVLFSSNSSDFMRFSFIPIFIYFNRNQKYLAVHSTWDHLLPKSLFHMKHRVGAVVLYDSGSENDEFLRKASNLELFDAYRTWLFILPEEEDKEDAIFKLSTLKIHIDSNVIISKLERPAEVTTRQPKTTTLSAITPAKNRDRIFCAEDYRQNREKKFDGSCGNQSSIPHRLKRQISGDPRIIIYLNQLYKLSKSEIDSSVESYLGAWDTANGFSNIEPPFDVERRSGLRGYRFSVGVKNITLDTSPVTTNVFHMEDELDEDAHLLELLDCMVFGLNSSYDLVQYTKLGWQNEEGGWTHLLGAVVDGTVDFALDTVDVSIDKLQNMFFTYPIVKSMTNIYFLRPDGGGMRDIFLEPFSPRLILCVFGTGFLLSIAMISITLANYRMIKKEGKEPEIDIISRKKMERTVVIRKNMDRKWEVTEAALWSISIICMQGSPWSPSTMSGNVLLIFSLVFALIIYNSYAAFITSVLSVKYAKIRTLEDLTESDFGFGYTLGGNDDSYLRTINDSMLRELYFKGLVENDGVNDPVDGVIRAAHGGYAFFVSARTARRALQTVVTHNQRCRVQELQLQQTKSEAAVPMSRKSPYKKIINYKVLRMMESGILQRLRKLILPPMPRCVERSTFNSARITDVYSAFTVLGSGIDRAELIAFHINVVDPSAF